MDLRDELIRLACDNRASAHPLSRFGIFPVFQKPSKGERASVSHGDRERQLRFSRFTPFVESVRRNQAPSFAECLPERGRFIDSLSSGVDGSVRNLWVFCPIWNQSPLQRIERPCLSFGIESDRQNLLTRRDIVTDRQISLLWDRDVVEPGELFFLGCSTIAAAHKVGKRNHKYQAMKNPE